MGTPLPLLTDLTAVEDPLSLYKACSFMLMFQLIMQVVLSVSNQVMAFIHKGVVLM